MCSLPVLLWVVPALLVVSLFVCLAVAFCGLHVLFVIVRLLWEIIFGICYVLLFAIYVHIRSFIFSLYVLYIYLHCARVSYARSFHDYVGRYHAHMQSALQ